MKKMMMTLLSLWLFYEVTAQNEPYYGGNGDGCATGDFSMYNLANPPQFYAYFGGDGDGHSMNEMSFYNMTNPSQFYAYFGGNGDGYAGSEITPYNMSNPSQLYAYFGGDGDGFAGNEIVPYNHTNPPQFYAYFGGNGDGYTGGEQAPYTMTNPPMFYAYFGGNGDGFAGDLLPLWIHPLSVKLLSFEGKADGDQSLLEWKVSEEKDIDRYELERSANGNSYSKLNAQKAKANNSAETRYEYVDVAPLEGNNYYRLRIIESNGRIEYSQVVLLYFKHGGQSVSVFPNPAQQTLHVKYSLNSKANLRITDMRGVTTEEQTAQSGSNTVSFSLERLAAGMYMLQITAENGFNKTIRFIKQ